MKSNWLCFSNLNLIVFLFWKVFISWYVMIPLPRMMVRLVSSMGVYLRLSLFLQLYFYFQILLLSNWILIVYLFWKVFISWFEVAKTHSIRNLIHLKNIPNQVTRVSWELRCYMVLKPFTIIFFFQILLLSNWILIVFLFFKYFYFRIEF
jgi:hypothetical protein